MGDLSIAAMFNIFAHKYLSGYLLFFHITKNSVGLGNNKNPYIAYNIGKSVI